VREDLKFIGAQLQKRDLGARPRTCQSRARSWGHNSIENGKRQPKEHGVEGQSSLNVKSLNGKR